MTTNAYEAEALDILDNVNNPNVDHGNVVQQVQNLNIIFVAITCAVVVLRTTVRGVIVQHVAVEDYLIILAVCSATAFSALVIYGLSRGLGRHVYDLPMSDVLTDVKKSIQILLVCQILYATALCLAKLSIISTYLRIFPRPWMRRTMFVLAGLVTSVWITIVFATIFQCRPIQAAWDFTIGRKCINIAAVNYFASAFSIFTDVLLCILPVPLLHELKVPKREKYMISALFGVGLFAAAASSVRIYTLKDLSSLDLTIKAMPALNWSVAEVGTGIICACIPCLKPLLKTLLPGRFSSTHRSTANHTANTPNTANATTQTERRSSRVEARAALSKSGVWRGRGVSWYHKRSPSDSWLRDEESLPAHLREKDAFDSRHASYGSVTP